MILLIFPLTKNYIENETYNKVEYYKEDLKDQINIMLKYKKDITVGEFIGRYSPDLSKDIKKDKALISKLMYDDDYSDFVRDRAHALTKWRMNYSDLDDELESLHLIMFGNLWKIKHLIYDNNAHWIDNASTAFYIENVYPIGLGYKKCQYYEKQYRTHPYTAIKMAFEYLISKDDIFSKSYTTENNIINAILSLKNKYFYITQKEQRDTIGMKPDYYYFAGSIFDNYTQVIYAIHEDEYEIRANTDLIETEVMHKTIIVISIAILFVIIIFITIIIIYKKHKKH